MRKYRIFNDFDASKIFKSLFVQLTYIRQSLILDAKLWGNTTCVLNYLLWKQFVVNIINVITFLVKREAPKTNWYFFQFIFPNTRVYSFTLSREVISCSFELLFVPTPLEGEMNYKLK